MAITYDAQRGTPRELEQRAQELFSRYRIVTASDLLVREGSLNNCVEIYPVTGYIDEIRFSTGPDGKLMVGARDRVSFQLKGILYVVNYMPLE